MPRTSVRIQNFRSLKGPFEVEIAPITVLLGENSSGKTALLAAIYASLRSFVPIPERLIDEPFLLPTPETQLTRGQTTMQLGSTRYNREHKFKCNAVFAKGSNFWSPSLVSASVGDVADVTSIRSKGRKYTYSYSFFDGDNRVFPRAAPSVYFGPQMHIPEFLASALRRQSRQTHSSFSTEPRYWVSKFLSQGSIHATAALRTQPQRMYDMRSITASAHGENIPQKLNNLLKSRSKSSREIREALNCFGRTSGLFDGIASKGIRTPAGEMFSLVLKFEDILDTIQDVGYGISQILPIVSEILLNQSADLFLIQQPEVHLHPKSQVSLASFFSSISQSLSKQFVIETHSDYIVDRLRVEVKEGRLEPDDILIYFLKKTQGETQLTAITVDRQGNLIGAPSDLRVFFMRDQMTLLGL